jgi:flagellar basal-body rod protein FlgC
MKITRLFGSLDISASALRAQRQKLNSIASNIANADTTRTDQGGPYKRQIAVLKASEVGVFTSKLQDAQIQLATNNDNHIQGIVGDTSSLTATASGVEARIQNDIRPPKMVFEPEHPDANAEGYVSKPDINVVTEMIDMISASRTYEANVTVINADKGMAKDALEI